MPARAHGSARLRGRLALLPWRSPRAVVYVSRPAAAAAAGRLAASLRRSRRLRKPLEMTIFDPSGRQRVEAEVNAGSTLAFDPDSIEKSRYESIASPRTGGPPEPPRTRPRTI